MRAAKSPTAPGFSGEPPPPQADFAPAPTDSPPAHRRSGIGTAGHKAAHEAHQGNWRTPRAARRHRTTHHAQEKQHTVTVP
ncbi:hypothetical protein GCM10009639_58360 [Kitasatospora putterlickiae]|uniref:Uncharacterized protein n=1 Tax=Kitasatospora putterlickiae TaxID=221725 RepID=A0ABP4J3B2_9ACTN